MKNILITTFIFLSAFVYGTDSITTPKIDTCTLSNLILDESSIQTITQTSNIYDERLQFLDAKTPMDLAYNEKVLPFIKSYIGKNKAIISRMQGLKELYFPLFESQLDKYDLPLEFKYLAIVESALDPRAKSGSGATGLWQFMYLTGKEYGLNVTSYVDERQDPLKSTQAACEYFIKLYEMFGNWNLVLAAYNGGPGYLQRKINSVGSYDFWQLQPYLRKETRNYVPIFIAVNYAMNYYKEHDILIEYNSVNEAKIDTITIKKQMKISTLSAISCVNIETINYLNPSFKKDIIPAHSVLVLPFFAVNDFLNNEKSNYSFVESVNTKEILIGEDRIVYRAVKGDYLGRVAKEFNVRVFEIKQWNNLTNTDLNIGDRLVIYVKNKHKFSGQVLKNNQREYVIQPGDTLWDIAQKHDGISVWKIKSLNNLEGDNLKPGTIIILPSI